MLIKKLIVTLFFFICNSNGRSQYCNICANHTMCKYNTPGPSKACVGYDMSSLINQQNAEDILSRVNEKRNFVAMGLSKKLPKAANMMKIHWSQELATFAQRWADQCSSGPDNIDQCRDLESIAVGQNVASVMGPSPGLSVKAFVDIWFMQVLDYNGSISYYNGSQDSNTAFFTQLIWADTELMGCAKVKYYLTNKRSDTERVICNFAPKGNIDGKPVYAIGFPSTQCPYDTKPDGNFTGLCTNNTTKDTLLPTSDPPVSSLLRIINLSDYAAPNETDPNRNLNNKDHFNDRFQKIRHIFNNDDKSDFSQIHDAEEKLKDYLLKYTRDNTFYDYIYGIDNRTHVTSQNIFFPSTILRHDIQSKYALNNNRGQTRSCTRSLFKENTSKKGVIPIISNQCTRKRDRVWNKENKVFTVLREKTRCNCNADCRNPADSYLENLDIGNRRRKVLSTIKPDSQMSLTKPGHFNYEPYNNFITKSSRLRYMNLPLITLPQYRSYENKQNLLSSHGQFVESLYKNERTEPHYWFNKNNRKKRTQNVAAIKPFWQIDDYKLNDMPLLKSLRYTTLAYKRHKTSRKRSSNRQRKLTKISNEITIHSRQEPSMSSEKYLSFEELMHLGKGNDGNHFIHARRKENIFNGRRSKGPTKAAATTKAAVTTKAKATTKAAVTTKAKATTTKAATTKVAPPAEADTAETETTETTEFTMFTLETPFHHVKYCTKKLTCTWTAIFQLGQDGGINGSAFGGGGIGGGVGGGAGGKGIYGGHIIGGGTKTPPGYVEGCTRTWTCTRPNFERNKGPTTTVNFQQQSATILEEDYCEKRALERRNLDENDYTLLETQSLSNDDNFPSSYTTEPMPLSYESSTIMHSESSEICPCNDESSRRRRHVETYDVRSKNIIDSDLSYGDLFYLVVQKIINKFKTENCRNKKCLCSKTTSINSNTLLLVYLLIFIKLFA